MNPGGSDIPLILRNERPRCIGEPRRNESELVGDGAHVPHGDWGREEAFPLPPASLTSRSEDECPTNVVSGRGSGRFAVQGDAVPHGTEDQPARCLSVDTVRLLGGVAQRHERDAARTSVTRPGVAFDST